MLTTLQRLAKRRCYPVKIGDDTFHVRSLTLGECETVDALPDEHKTAFAIGCSLVDDAGQQAIPRTTNPEENDEGHAVYAARVAEALTIVPGDALVALLEAIWKVTKAAPVEELVKN